jgi:DNA helicase-2/ATP-dependent DNA helicase PcrA
MNRLRSIISGGSLPWSLLESSPSDLVVSTVHRAKGLEFDRVFVMDGHRCNDVDPAESVRLDYVELSRARDEIYLASVPQPKAGYRRGAGRRWVEQRWYKRRPLPHAMEFRPTDVDVHMPFGQDAAEAIQLQDLLVRSDMIGRNVTARLDERHSNNARPVYELLLEDGTKLGRTSLQFGNDFAKTFWRPRGASWPVQLDHLMITAIESAAGEPDDTLALGLGPGGLWLVPRILGLATPKWR